MDTNKTTIIELDVRVQTFDMNKRDLINAMVAGSKLTKVDAGRFAGNGEKDTLVLRIEPLENENGIILPNITLESYSKVPDAVPVKTA